MPIIEAHILKGHDSGARTRPAHGLTDALGLTPPAPPESITVPAHELAHDNSMRGGARRRRGAPPPDALELVRRAHAAHISGDFAAAAAASLTEDAIIIMPGGAQASTPHDIAVFTASRRTEMAMTVESPDLCSGAAGPVVDMRTRISGTLRDGTRPEDLRSMVRFEFRGPPIARIDAMSDLPQPSPERT